VTEPVSLVGRRRVPVQVDPVRRGPTLHPSILDTVAIVGLGPRPSLGPGVEPGAGVGAGVGAGIELGLALAFAATGFGVIGIDPDPALVAAVRAGRLELAPGDRDRLDRLRDHPRLGFGTDAAALAETETVVVRPGDRAAADAVGRHVRAGQLVLVAGVRDRAETVTTITAAFAERGLVAGEDVHLVTFVPEPSPAGPGGLGGLLEGATEHCVARAVHALRRVAPRARGRAGPAPLARAR
jgi:hypothetical protein